MADDTPNDLNTGHFGIPTYDLDNSRWAFLRTPTGARFRQLDPWKVVVSPAIQFPAPQDSRTLRDAQYATKSLAHDFPELVPASQHISVLEPVSAAASIAPSAQNATVGQLMSFGTITSLGHLAKTIVALPTGEGGNILRLQLLSKERRGWGTRASRNMPCYLDCLCWTDDQGFWNQDATAIRQVCFAQSEKPGSFLALRLQQSVALFRPTYCRRPTAAAKAPLYDLPPSVIDAHPFHNVWIGDTGNVPHADVAFNPHYQRQFAIVDRKLNWSVWDIDGTRRSYVVKRAASGILPAEVDDDRDQEEDIEAEEEDCWARILWVGDANTLLVCNRRRIQLIDLKQPSRALDTPQVIDWRSTHKSSDSWILDVKRHPSLDDKQFFVLTSNRLYLMAVVSDEAHGTLSSPGVCIVLSWTHFRGTEDVSLLLHVQSMSDDGTFFSAGVGLALTPHRNGDLPAFAHEYVDHSIPFGGPDVFRGSMSHLRPNYASTR